MRQKLDDCWEMERGMSGGGCRGETKLYQMGEEGETSGDIRNTGGQQEEETLETSAELAAPTTSSDSKQTETDINFLSLADLIHFWFKFSTWKPAEYVLKES